MTLFDLINRTRAYIRDKDGNIFERFDIVDFINEGIDRMSTVSELSNIPYLYDDEDDIKLIPSKYHHLLAIYASARCFEVDERFYQGTQRMNEFENKMEELKSGIEEGEIIILDEITGEVVQNDLKIDYVVDEYYGKRKSMFDEDN